MSTQSGGETKHVCVLCNTPVDSKEALQEHFRKHANKEIDLKGRRIGPTGELRELQTPAGKSYVKGTGSQYNTNVVCDVCGEAFTCNTRAIQHKFKKHPFSAAKHYCPQCGMQFILKGHRDKHLKDQHETDHASRNPYPCYMCDAVFYNSTAHQYHLKSAHHRRIETPPPSKKIRCNNAGEPQSALYCHLCGAEYIVKFNLEKHLERQHSQAERSTVPPNVFKCITCEALFYNQKAYANHNSYHKPDDLYVTSEEQRLQTVSRVDQDFDARRVQPATEKYIPRFRRRRTSIIDKNKGPASLKLVDDEEFSQPSSDSDDDPEEPIPQHPPPQLIKTEIMEGDNISVPADVRDKDKERGERDCQKINSRRNISNPVIRDTSTPVS